MRPQIVFKILGALLIIFSTTLIPPIALSWYYRDGVAHPFIYALIITFALGAASWLPVRKFNGDLRFRDGFLVVVLFWTVLASVGALPLAMAHHPVMSVVDALFESMSGLTTTGATVLAGIDNLPISVLYYRQQLQWLGGMGIIVLAVAVMPMLGVGGMQLYRAEIPGPVKDSKLTPRIRETARLLWFLYLALTVVCGVAYWLAGMTPFDAVVHSFSTVSTGGFSTHDASLGYFHSPVIAIIATFFMVVSSINYSVHFLVWRKLSPRPFIQDRETVVFLSILVSVALLTFSVLLYDHIYNKPYEDLWHSFFDVVSVATTTGFSFGGFYWWPTFLPVLMILLSAIGGCAGSTAGGMKVIRVILLYKQGHREMTKLIHPSALVPIKVGGKPVSENVINAVWGFLALYILSYVLLSLAMVASGSDFVTAFSTVTATLNNLGPALGEAAENYATISGSGKLILTFSMLLGRLELFTLLVLFTPAFWRS